ncbi:MAG: nitroreductase family protein [Candidatus Cryptobacteroides sp.]
MRRYKDEPIPEEILTPLRDRIREINKKAGLHIQLVTGELRAFSGHTPRKPCSRTPRHNRPFREVQVIRQDLSGEGTDEFFLPFVVLMSAV